MLAPIKIVLISTSLLNPAKIDKPIILYGDYSDVAMKYRIKRDYDSSNDINNILYKALIREHDAPSE
jgi:hypothetical protein